MLHSDSTEQLKDHKELRTLCIKERRSSANICLQQTLWKKSGLTKKDLEYILYEKGTCGLPLPKLSTLPWILVPFSKISSHEEFYYNRHGKETVSGQTEELQAERCMTLFSMHNY